MEPVRTCLGCRQRADRSTLVRVIARDGEVVVDHSAILPGRGAWVHPARECMETAIQRKAFGRALKVAPPLALGQILTLIEASTEAQKKQAD